MGADCSAPPRRESPLLSPVTFTKLCWVLHGQIRLILLVVIQQADLAASCLTQPQHLSWCDDLQSAEQWNGSARAPHAVGEVPSSCLSLHCSLLFLCIIGLPPSLCAGGGVLGCLGVDCGHTAACIQSQLSNSISVSLMLHQCCLQRPLYAPLTNIWRHQLTMLGRGLLKLIYINFRHFQVKNG